MERRRGAKSRACWCCLKDNYGRIVRGCAHCHIVTFADMIDVSAWLMMAHILQAEVRPPPTCHACAAFAQSRPHLSLVSVFSVHRPKEHILRPARIQKSRSYGRGGASR